ncbi:glycoside hydrolase family 20 zincin-like fold domain-containing protein [uncultured Sphaerochaeta sp.]|uniref:glycoside hydrolase family 20 zincin-like fold domain-containing protein n=1 Tax=uncultured Sphaerochaeta sp. TaxID=886478 RepID=UPI002A0A5019|nr:glycoside hydrolase family 20 zincin-like fold domain-containing protein [uncultured Sphaerochaeta sp.]
MYTLFPEPQKIKYGKNITSLSYEHLKVFTNCSQLVGRVTKSLSINHVEIVSTPSSEDEAFFIRFGSVSDTTVPVQKQGFSLVVGQDSLSITSSSEQGLFYGCLAWEQLTIQGKKSGHVQAMELMDWPVLENRGLMLDISRGRVYSLDYLKQLVEKLATLRINVLQLYIEHTFAFSFLADVHKGSSPITAEEVRELDQWCKKHYIELQANLQSFGHCNRLLTTKGFRHFRESDLYWTLSPAVEETYTLLDRMFAEFLPNFTSNVLNIDSDETYDLGSGKSAALIDKEGKGEVYLNHLLRVRELAAKHGKTLMVFGDVILRHPELLEQIPQDIVFLDWIYDPSDTYTTPKKFAVSKRTFWVCPGTGAWNTLFPRQDGAVKNIQKLTIEGVNQGAMGMLLCDWGDHGSYTPPVFSMVAFAVAAQVGWNGREIALEDQLQAISMVLGEPMLQKLHLLLPQIHRLPAFWSKNRSQCSIALFDEPLMGRMLTNALPPKNLEPFEPLPEGVAGVLDPESHHLMRPLFSISEESLEKLTDIEKEARELVGQLHDDLIRSQYEWLCDSLQLICEKLRLGRSIRSAMLSASADYDQFLDWEIELRLLIGKFTQLEMDFVSWWMKVAKVSEIMIPLTYFAHIIERLDYLKGWLAAQRQAIETNHEVDWAMTSYQTAGYKSLPTY